MPVGKRDLREAESRAETEDRFAGCLLKGEKIGSEAFQAFFSLPAPIFLSRFS